MGHVRVGRLPKSRSWRDVTSLLGTMPQDVQSIAAAVLIASDDRLRQVDNDGALAYCFWLLTRLEAASDSSDFAGEVTELGLSAPEGTQLLTFLAAVSDRVWQTVGPSTDSGHFRELAALALRRTLLETAGEQGPSLFGSTVEQLQEGLRRNSGAEQFARVSTLFFGDFVARVLRRPSIAILRTTWAPTRRSKEQATVRRLAVTWNAMHGNPRESFMTSRATGTQSVAGRRTLRSHPGRPSDSSAWRSGN